MSERLYVDSNDWSDGASRPHLFRYLMAKGFVNKYEVVNDLACGCGYGSAILADVAGEVHGFDYSPEVIMHAESYHQPGHHNLKFEVKDLNKVDELPRCHMSVSIETIEHLENPEKFARMLKNSTERLIFLTTPIVPTVGENPHHLHDFTPFEVESLFCDDVWKPFHSYKQGAGPDSMYGGFIFYKPK